MPEGHGTDPQPLKREHVASFLARLYDRPVAHLEPLGGGFWSSAWGYQANGEELVVRFGRNKSWYEIDRMAMAFDGQGLPVPAVRDVGIAPDGRAYAISERHRGIFLEEIPIEQAPALAPTLTGLLVALHDVSAAPDASVLWHSPDAPPVSWRQFLMAGLVDDPDSMVHGWSASLSADPTLSRLSLGATERISALADALPERRDLVHGDLLHGNVLVSPDARRVEAVYSWKCSVRGDFLYDAAWCTFWAPWHEGIAAMEPLAGVLAAPTVRVDPSALVDAAARHHCYELQIGYTHLGWNIWTGIQSDLDATAKRLSEVLDRGPLPRLEVPRSTP
jgi:aminoglycoside phosphotransferase (APT) family kinase protein